MRLGLVLAMVCAAAPARADDAPKRAGVIITGGYAVNADELEQSLPLRSVQLPPDHTEVALDVSTWWLRPIEGEGDHVLPGEYLRFEVRARHCFRRWEARADFAADRGDGGGLAWFGGGARYRISPGLNLSGYAGYLDPGSDFVRTLYAEGGVELKRRTFQNLALYGGGFLTIENYLFQQVTPQYAWWVASAMGFLEAQKPITPALALFLRAWAVFPLLWNPGFGETDEVIDSYLNPSLDFNLGLGALYAPTKHYDLIATARIHDDVTFQLTLGVRVRR